MSLIVEVVVSLSPAINDPQGLVVRDGLRQLGFGGVSAVRVGKHIEVELEDDDPAAARAEVVRMCERLLHNPVIEEYRIGAIRSPGG